MRLKTLSIFLVLCAALPLACAQSERRISPHETTRATVDGAEISIAYGRPSMRGRQIFGSLVPYDKVWCPGADECTKLTTNRTLKFGDVTLKPGSYTLWMIPTATDWTLIFSSEADAWHTRYHSQYDAGRIKLQKRTISDPVEQLTFEIVSQPGGGGAVEMSWEKTQVSAPFSVEH